MKCWVSSAYLIIVSDFSGWAKGIFAVPCDWFKGAKGEELIELIVCCFIVLFKVVRQQVQSDSYWNLFRMFVLFMFCCS